MSVSLIPLLGLSLLDSINPSALAATMYLMFAGRPFAAKVLTYVGAVFVSYLGLGGLLMLGLNSARGYLDSPLAYAIQGIVGVVLLAYAFFAPDKSLVADKGVRKPRSLNFGAIFLLGVTVTVVEFSTAFPYLGAVTLMTNAGLSPMQWLPILGVYNAIFVAPPLLLLVAYLLFGSRWRDASRSSGSGSRVDPARQCCGSQELSDFCSWWIAWPSSTSSGSFRI